MIRFAPIFRKAAVVVVVLSPVSCSAQIAHDAKVVFLKGTALMTAKADGSNVQTLVNGGIYKTDPHRSPAGDKILYDTPTNVRSSAENTDNLVVVTDTGQLPKSIPQDTGADWAIFSVDEVGWYGNNAIFVTGAVNHTDKEYISLDLDTGHALRDLEEPTGEDVGFQTCSTNAQVAYPVDARADTSTPSLSVHVNGSTVYTARLPAQLRPGGIPFLLSDLHWSEDCSRLSLY